MYGYLIVIAHSYFSCYPSYCPFCCCFQALLSFILSTVDLDGVRVRKTENEEEKKQSKISTTVVSMSFMAGFYCFYLFTQFYVRKHLNILHFLRTYSSIYWYIFIRVIVVVSIWSLCVVVNAPEFNIKHSHPSLKYVTKIFTVSHDPVFVIVQYMLPLQGLHLVRSNMLIDLIFHAHFVYTYVSTYRLHLYIFFYFQSLNLIINGNCWNDALPCNDFQ